MLVCQDVNLIGSTKNEKNAAAVRGKQEEASRAGAKGLFPFAFCFLLLFAFFISFRFYPIRG
jgi:hypothetical protein